MNCEFLISLKMINHTNHALDVPHFKAMDIPLAFIDNTHTLGP